MLPSFANRPELKRLIRIFANKPLNLSDYHAAGEQLRRLQDNPELAQYASWKATVTELTGQSEATLNKCLQLRRAYEQADLPELEQLGVGWARVTIALAVKDRKKRHQLLRRTSKEGWDDQDLRREVQRLKGSRRGGGRTRKPCQSHGLLADVGELSRLSEVWNDFYDQVFGKMQQAYAAERDKLSAKAREGVSKQVHHAFEQLECLQERVDKALRPGRESRSGRGRLARSETGTASTAWGRSCGCPWR